MKTRNATLAFLLSLLFVFSACIKDKQIVEYDSYVYTDQEYELLNKNLNLPEYPLDYQVPTPNHMRAIGIRFPAISNNKATLGRVLFYDPQLSQNNTVSCASCHLQDRAFADKVAFSEGFQGEKTLRNSFALGAVANTVTSYDGTTVGSESFRSTLFWDNRARNIAQQSKMTLADPIEMGMQMGELVDRLEKIDYYQVLFKKAYPGDKISEFTLLDALEEFINSMITVDSKFDRAMNIEREARKDFKLFSDQENLGKNLYINHCANCHGENMVTTTTKNANNGLDMVYQDKGIGGRTFKEHDNGKFKVPMLRNVELTGPYMHDGRFETLEEVVEHYSSGVQAHQNLSIMLKDQDDETKARHLNLNGEEKEALIAFLKTLTDPAFTQAERYSDPFK